MARKDHERRVSCFSVIVVLTMAIISCQEDGPTDPPALNRHNAQAEARDLGGGGIVVGLARRGENGEIEYRVDPSPDQLRRSGIDRLRKSDQLVVLARTQQEAIQLVHPTGPADTGSRPA